MSRYSVSDSRGKGFTGGLSRSASKTAFGALEYLGRFRAPGTQIPRAHTLGLRGTAARGCRIAAVADEQITVTRIDDHKSKVTPYDYGANNAVTHAIHATFGEDANRLEFVGCSDRSKDESFYAIVH